MHFLWKTDSVRVNECETSFIMWPQGRILPFAKTLVGSIAFLTARSRSTPCGERVSCTQRRRILPTAALQTAREAMSCRLDKVSLLPW